ncbi:MAG: zonular occludens toxin domain-containing protein, partial [Glaciimonas sp.]|nr:zonular occludens toxin domain-containing protein [Glaciimonas sp.]
MITLITGLPDNGKTLYSLFYIKALAEKDQREVYYSGIKDLTLPWTESKPEEWMSLPAGAIMVIDECQFVFSKKPNGSKLPDFYDQLAVHRHKGIDLFLITQHPNLLDSFVRSLVGRHLHIIRKFGLQRATIYEWSGVNMMPQNASSHKNAIVHKWGYPKEVYSYYKSAEVHTVKRSFPIKIIVAGLFIA